MHRADREIVALIERAYIEHGYKPMAGVWILGDRRCGLGALDCQSDYHAVCQLIDIGFARDWHWIDGFTAGFDDCFQAVWPNADYLTGPKSRGYRAGWCCAKLVVWNKPPVESVPQTCIERISRA